MKRVDVIAVCTLFAISIGGALAQSTDPAFPVRPLRYIVPFPPGGSTDIVARIMAAALTEKLGQQVVIDNRGGAGGTVGAEIAARAAADGYSLFACNIASLAVSPALYLKLGYDPDTGFAPIGLIGSSPNSLVVHPAIPTNSVAEFIAFVKSRPGKLNYASAGIGTSPQLSMELFKTRAGLDIVHIPYKGAGPAVADLVGGHVHAMFATVPSILGASRGGKVRVLGVTSIVRSTDLPEVPTIAESGMTDFEVVSWQGLCTPAGTPTAVLGRIRAALSAALASPETRKQLADQSVQTNALDAEAFGAYIRSERAKWLKVVKDAGIVPR